MDFLFPEQAGPPGNKNSIEGYDSPPAKDSEKLSSHDDLRSGFTSTAETLNKVEECKEKA